MARFVTATLNSAIDRIIRIERWTPGIDMRGPAVVECLGGKGMDSAVALTCMGQEATGVVNVAGPAGDRVIALGQGYGIDVRPVRVGGSTRESHVVVETATGEMSHITCGTLETTATGFEEFARTLRRALDGAAFFIASGSLPRGLGPEAYEQLVDLAGEAGVPALVDCSGQVLVERATATDAVVKCNDDEYAEAFGLASASGHGIEAVVTDLRERLLGVHRHLRGGGPAHRDEGPDRAGRRPTAARGQRRRSRRLGFVGRGLAPGAGRRLDRDRAVDGSRLGRRGAHPANGRTGPRGGGTAAASGLRRRPVRNND